MQFIITTESNAEIPLSWVRQWEIPFMRMPYIIDDVTYEYDLGEHIDILSFYGELRKGKIPTTVLRNTEEYRAFFLPILEQGQDILHVAFSSAMSGSFHCATLAAEELRAQFPARQLVLVDTLAICMAAGVLVGCAARMRDEGKSLTEVAEWLEANKLRAQAFATVNDLFHLKRGGRVTGTAALMGTVLDIKPILRINAAGQLIPEGKVTGRKKAIRYLVEQLEANGENLAEQEVFIMHGDCLEDAQYLEKLVQERCAPKAVVVQLVGPVIGTHAGPGVLALIFMGKPRT